MLTSEDAVHGSFCCACYGVLLLIEGFLVQQALALGNADAGNCITHHVQGGDQHLDGAVDGQDQGVGQQSAVVDEAHAGQDGKQDDSPSAGSGGLGLAPLPRGLHKAGEFDDGTGRLEHGLAGGFGRRGQTHGGGGTGGVSHLAGKRALPDQRV